MTVMTRTKFDVVPLNKHIGAEIRGLDLRRNRSRHLSGAQPQAG
jgi:hypothetical protein